MIKEIITDAVKHYIIYLALEEYINDLINQLKELEFLNRKVGVPLSKWKAFEKKKGFLIRNLHVASNLSMGLYNSFGDVHD